jgi:hypothetical protein
MYCPRCGSEITGTSKFCRNCGLPIEQIAGYVAGEVPPPIEAPDEYLTPRQQLVLTILLIVMSPALVAVASEMMGLDGSFAAFPAVLAPFGIVWAFFHYKATMRRRERQAVAPPRPAIQPPPVQLPPHDTNPLNAPPPRSSVVEDETRRFNQR